MLIAHHGGGGIGSLAEPKATFGPLSDRFRVVVFDARGCGHSEGIPPYSHAQWAADVDGLRAVDRRGQDRRRGRLLRRIHRPRVRRGVPRARPGDRAARHLRRRDQPRARLRERAEPGPGRDQLGQLRPLLVRADPRRRGPQGALGGDHPAVRLRVRPGPLGGERSRPASTVTRPTTGASSTTSRTTTSSRSSPRSRCPRSSPSAGATGSPRSAPPRPSRP